MTHHYAYDLDAKHALSLTMPEGGLRLAIEKATAKHYGSNDLTDGKYDEETIMILNNQEAKLFLIENAEELSITPFVIRNLHQILSQDLLKNSNACDQIRQIEVKIAKSAYHGVIRS